MGLRTIKQVISCWRSSFAHTGAFVYGVPICARVNEYNLLRAQFVAYITLQDLSSEEAQPLRV